MSVLDGVGGQLPREDQSFDAGVAALVLCTIPDPHQALAELIRVIRPGDELGFYEHVVAHAKWEARFQRLADATFWPRIAGDYHLARARHGRYGSDIVRPPSSRGWLSR